MLLDTTVRRELARGFGTTLTVIFTIELTMMLIRTLGLAAAGGVAPQDMVLLLGYTALMHLPTTLAVSLFVAVVAALGRMYRDSEMAVWFASGVSLTRFVRPVLSTSWPVLLVVGVLVFVVWPWSNRMSMELRERYQQRSDLSRVVPGMFLASSDGSRVYFVERDTAQSATQARNVFVLTNDARGEVLVSAHGARIVSEGGQRVLLLQHGQRTETVRATAEMTLANFDAYRIVVDEQQHQRLHEHPAPTLSTLELLRQPGIRQQAELAWRLGLLLGAANLALLGIGLSAANPRRASSLSLAFALLTFVVYYNLINLTQAWIGSGRVSFAVAVLGLHGLALAVAVALLWGRGQGEPAFSRWHGATGMPRFGRRAKS